MLVRTAQLNSVDDHEFRLSATEQILLELLVIQQLFALVVRVCH